MGKLFVAKKKLVDPYIIAVDSIVLKAKGHLWHKSSMKKGEVPHSGIDTDARWGFSHTKGWMFVDTNYTYNIKHRLSDSTNIR